MADTYLKLHDGFPENRKVVAAGGDAAWLHVCALAYASRNLTDGLVPEGVVSRLSDRKQPARLASKLVNVGLWHQAGHDCPRCPQPGAGEYLIHDYLKHQRSAAKVEELRGVRAKSGSQGGRKKAENARSRGEAQGKQTPSNLLDGQGGPGAGKSVTKRSQPTSNKRGGDAGQRPVTLFSESDEIPVTAGQENEGPSNLLAGSQSAAVANGYPDTETDTEEVLRTSSLPPSAGADAPQADAPVTSQTIVGEWLDRCQSRPPSRVIGQLSKEIKGLLDEGINPDHVRRGVAEWMTRNAHPSTLASFVNGVMNASPSRIAGQPSNGSGSQLPPRDADYSDPFKRKKSA